MMILWKKYKNYPMQIMVKLIKDNLCLPMDNRCVAAPNGVNDYVIYQDGGLSWSVCFGVSGKTGY